MDARPHHGVSTGAIASFQLSGTCIHTVVYLDHIDAPVDPFSNNDIE